MAKQDRNRANAFELHPIFCPYCMKTYPANNVVFRKSRTDKTASYDFADDPYLQDYNETFHKNKTTYLPRTIDPAYIVSEDDKVYEYGMLVGVRDVEGDRQIAKDRLCPYCHNSLIRLAGTMKTHVLSVVGFKGSGKTTYECTLLDVMEGDHIGVLNCSECDNPNVLDDNIPLIRAGKAVNSTQAEEGPFHYQITFNKNEAKSFILNMVDLPGEYFGNPEAIGTAGEAIPNSDTCVFLVDLKQLEEAKKVFGTLVSNYRTRLLSGRVNVAVVLYKADQLIRRFPQIPTFLSFRQKRDYRDSAPVNMDQINSNSEDIVKYIVQKDEWLGALHTALTENIPVDNLRWFAAFSMNNGVYAPNNVEEPLLWSLALKGMYPKV